MKRPSRPTLRLLALVCAGLANGCDSGPDLPELPDGDYRLRLSSPVIVDPFGTPGWMYDNVELDFTRVGDEVTVTDRNGDHVALGPAQRFEQTAEGWVLEVALSRLQDGEHYWTAEITDRSCASPQAVDADIGHTPTGMTVDFAFCSIRRR